MLLSGPFLLYSSLAPSPALTVLELYRALRVLAGDLQIDDFVATCSPNTIAIGLLAPFRAGLALPRRCIFLIINSGKQSMIRIMATVPIGVVFDDDGIIN